MREFDFIQWIRRQTQADPRTVPVGPGDDCAVIAPGGAKGEELLVTTDQVLDGVHFILSRDGARAAGRKAMARNLSDIAAMAGVPLAAVAAVALPKGMTASQCREIYRGLRSVGDRFGCPVVGGDVSAWNGPLAITVTILGRVGDPVRGKPRTLPSAAARKRGSRPGPVLRSGARAGDAICVTGALGGAWRTRRHLEFMPRVAEALALAAAMDLHAMIDISDGLLADLGHICRELRDRRAELLAADIPVHPDAKGLAAALGDGEDYELLFTLPARQAKAWIARPPAGVKVTRIGTIRFARRIVLVHPDGRREKAAVRGWEHRT